jgi:hypothetical protein
MSFDQLRKTKQEVRSAREELQRLELEHRALQRKRVAVSSDAAELDKRPTSPHSTNIDSEEWERFLLAKQSEAQQHVRMLRQTTRDKVRSSKDRVLQAKQQEAQSMRTLNHGMLSAQLSLAKTVIANSRSFISTYSAQLKDKSEMAKRADVDAKRAWAERQRELSQFNRSRVQDVYQIERTRAAVAVEKVKAVRADKAQMQTSFGGGSGEKSGAATVRAGGLNPNIDFVQAEYARQKETEMKELDAIRARIDELKSRLKASHELNDNFGRVLSHAAPSLRQAPTAR